MNIIVVSKFNLLCDFYASGFACNGERGRRKRRASETECFEKKRGVLAEKSINKYI